MTHSSRSGAAGNQGRPGPSGQRLPAEARLRRASDIRRVLRTGRRTSGSYVDVISASSPASRPRVGVIVPRYGNSAVSRNRVRRRLKEVARREWLPQAWVTGDESDVILRAKPSAYGASYEALRDQLNESFGRLCKR